jgi:hypothetical protein
VDQQTTLTVPAIHEIEYCFDVMTLGRVSARSRFGDIVERQPDPPPRR